MSLTWPAKHPAEVADYTWSPGLDAGDTISTASINVTEGTVSATARAPQTGGTAGETNVLYAIVTTTGGRTFDETIYLSINALVAIDPNVAALKMRYPAFAAVDDATVAYWLADAKRFVDVSWNDGDYAPGLIAAAAHNMSKTGVAGISGSQLGGFAAAGVTRFKSGTFDAQFSDVAIKVAVAGGWASTPYGQDYLDLLRRNVSGFGVTSPGTVVVGCGFNGFAGPLSPWTYP
jgi:hypothetical protein